MRDGRIGIKTVWMRLNEVDVTTYRKTAPLFLNQLQNLPCCYKSRIPWVWLHIFDWLCHLCHCEASILRWFQRGKMGHDFTDSIFSPVFFIKTVCRFKWSLDDVMMPLCLYLLGWKWLYWPGAIYLSSNHSRPHWVYFTLLLLCCYFKK